MSLSPSSGCEEQVENPFETAEWLHNLDKPIKFSPRMFEVKKSPKCSKTGQKLFQWDIHELATLKPVDIDENSFQADFYNIRDHRKEALVEDALNRYFSQDEILSSPLNEPLPTVKLPLTPKQVNQDDVKIYLRASVSAAETRGQSSCEVTIKRQLFSDEESEVVEDVQEDKCTHESSYTPVSVSAKAVLNGLEIHTPPASPLSTPNATSSMTPVSAQFSSSPICRKAVHLSPCIRHGSTLSRTQNSPILSLDTCFNVMPYRPTLSKKLREFRNNSPSKFLASPALKPPNFPPFSPINYMISPNKDTSDDSTATSGSTTGICFRNSTQDTGYQSENQRPDSPFFFSQISELQEGLAGKRLFSEVCFASGDADNPPSTTNTLQKCTSSPYCQDSQPDDSVSVSTWLPNRGSFEFRFSQEDLSLMSDLGVSFLDAPTVVLPECVHYTPDDKQTKRELKRQKKKHSDILIDPNY